MKKMTKKKKTKMDFRLSKVQQYPMIYIILWASTTPIKE